MSLDSRIISLFCHFPWTCCALLDLECVITYHDRITHPAPGIPEELIQEMFYYNNGVSREGLGLYISQKLVKIMNGTVKYLREAEKSSFIILIEFPFARKPPSDESGLKLKQAKLAWDSERTVWSSKILQWLLKWHRVLMRTLGLQWLLHSIPILESFGEVQWRAYCLEIEHCIELFLGMTLMNDYNIRRSMILVNLFWMEFFQSPRQVDAEKCILLAIPGKR